MDEPVYVSYDFEVRILGQRYLCVQKDGAPGYHTIPVGD